MKPIEENLSIIEMKKVKVKMNKPIYLGLSILEIRKTTMYEFWYNYMKRKYGDMVKLCYTDTDSLVMNIKTKDVYKDIAKNGEERFDTSNYGFDRPLPKGKNKKVIGLMKDELRGGIITKGTKKCVTRKFEHYKKCLLDDKIILKSQQRFKSESHEVYTEDVNKIALSNDDDKRIVSPD